MKILTFDPSGSFVEGQGTTGYSLFEDGELRRFGHIDSKQYGSQEEYWNAHWQLVLDIRPKKIVCESYRLQSFKAMQQSGSQLETPQLIGFLKMMCWAIDLPLIFQNPSDKVRVADPQLVQMGVLEKVGNRYKCLGKQTIIHERDSIRHGIYFFKYGKGRNSL